MIRYLIVSVIYIVLFLMSSKFDAMQAIVGGFMVGAASIGALKLFGMDKK